LLIQINDYYAGFDWSELPHFFYNTAYDWTILNGHISEVVVDIVVIW